MSIENTKDDHQPAGLGAMTGSAMTDADLHECVSNVPHNWGKWKVTDKIFCTNWGTVNILQSRECSICGLTQSKRQKI